MKLPSHLAKSRHGVFYFRLTFRLGATTKEKRISLRTKNSQEARLKAQCLSVIMMISNQKRQKIMATDYLNTAESIAREAPDSDFLLSLLHRVDREQLAELSGLSLQEVSSLLTPPSEPDVRKLDIEMPGGFVLRNINSDDDVNRAVHILQTLNLSTEALAKLIAGPNPQRVAPELQPALQASPKEEGGTTIQEMVPRFATRKKNKLAEKTLYEYGNYHQKFVAWLETRKKKKHIPVHSITRADVADFIDDLLGEGLSPKTITQKYLAAISGLFELAQTIGVLPEGQQLVSRGHKVFTKNDAKKASASNGYKPFTDDELKAIFQPQLLSEAQRPADFWLPMLGLFTGGRISELAQLDIADIQQHEGIWAISINGEGDKSIKTLAATRLIPIHPILLDCGFLDYVNDTKAYGTKIFPYLTPDTFGSYGATPSERWGKYLDKLGIKDKQKVFHSFRSTSNDRLKQNGVPEESRCQFVGHEHDTIN
ncbi:phage integrase N-terminal SAM-like domain-containing protein [Laribacter hongkongensis]|uniref:tyrosine-type recombinase/integrase n=1 Tax=Laribacter hongkongensis TaxID=168471 RepID=UPI001EFD7117|nr:phage integrase N-terminal SAM-like domain-containing protein [Laribacter hongkongensis]MCG9107716.1 phage integrase N-terminal SAM-like domain-containing protein [Laribacter hongkongensis]